MTEKSILEKLDVHTIRLYRENKDKFDREQTELGIELKRNLTQDELFAIIFAGYLRDKFKRIRGAINK